jgi:hypothetical protein
MRRKSRKRVLSDEEFEPFSSAPPPRGPSRKAPSGMSLDEMSLVMLNCWQKDDGEAVLGRWNDISI